MFAGIREKVSCELELYVSDLYELGIEFEEENKIRLSLGIIFYPRVNLTNKQNKH